MICHTDKAIGTVQLFCILQYINIKIKTEREVYLRKLEEKNHVLPHHSIIWVKPCIRMNVVSFYVFRQAHPNASYFNPKYNRSEVLNGFRFWGRTRTHGFKVHCLSIWLIGNIGIPPQNRTESNGFGDRHVSFTPEVYKGRFSPFFRVCADFKPVTVCYRLWHPVSVSDSPYAEVMESINLSK